MSHRAQGFSLVELMVAMTLGLFVVGVVVAIFVNNSRNLRAIEHATRHAENGRYATQLLGDDIRHAGFFAEFDPGTMAMPTAKPDPCTSSPTAVNASLPLHVQGYDGADGGLSCLSGVRGGTDVLVIRRAKTCIAGSENCGAVGGGKLYFQASQCHEELESGQPFDLDSDLANLTRRKRDCAASADLREMLVHIYFISSIDRGGRQIPALTRWELGRGIVPLVEGIQDLQIEYGVDDDGDGTPDRYTANPDDPLNAALTVQNWQNVTAIRVHLLSREIDESPGYKDEKAFTLGLTANGQPNTAMPFNDAYRRHLYDTTFVVNNIAGRRQR